MWYTIGMNGQIISELVQVSGFLALLIMTGRKNPPLTNAGLLWFVVSLSYDVGVLRCVRPHYVLEVYNAWNVVVGWIVLYEKYKLVYRRVASFVVSLFL